ncbi:MAG: 2-phospho-L-lactate transferase/gluconeogenesis factor, CofD/UPF0052 family [Chloroflexi bacterium]|jgi:uncharacterized cofD-like protein|nr:MAG: 2-phospho-L-lactate transferase/gluconeogenesis factor, CofD/UPF0052 family [Chloroflexota bacterium]
MTSKKIFKWLYFGLQIKRWLFLILIGVIFMGLGIAYLLKEAYLVFVFPEWIGTITLQWLPRWIRGLLFILLSASITLIGAWKLNQSIISTLIPNKKHTEVIDSIYESRFLRDGPSIAVIGGGTGMSMLLRGLKKHTSNLTAIITVADDGGSSGRLRKDLKILPPGDIRACISALASAEPLITELFEYRFNETEGKELSGHSLGNLLIAGMAEITGSMENGIEAISKVLNVKGKILPSTLDDVQISAHLNNGKSIIGESNIGKKKDSIKQLTIDPIQPTAFKEATIAIEAADVIIIGPGSLFTSILPNLLIPGIVQSIKKSNATKIFVTNVATQFGETNQFNAYDHFKVIHDHVDANELIDIVLSNDFLVTEPLLDKYNANPVISNADEFPKNIEVILENLVDQQNRYHHNSNLLAKAILKIIYKKNIF